MPPGDRRRRRVAPALEPLEPRELAAIVGAGAVKAHASMARHALRASAASDGGQGQPTPHEQDRRRFRAAYYGRFAVGPGRTTDVATQVYINGAGNSSAFLHGQYQVALTFPADPSQGIQGTAVFYPNSFILYGNLLVLDLENAGPLDAHGLPQHMTWTVSDNSAGIFTGAQGQGTVDIHIKRYATHRGRVQATGTLTTRFRGDVATVGLYDPKRLSRGTFGVG